ncbi:MAG: XdhC family protein [Gemmatimonadales bacterium]
MHDVLADYDRFLAEGQPPGRAVVTSVWGSAPRHEGACLLATADGKIAGSVSGGCVETATAAEVQAAIDRNGPKLVTFGVTDETAWRVGLACGGTIKVFVEPAVRPEILEAARSGGGMVVATVLEGPASGASLTVRDDNSPAGVNRPSWTGDTEWREWAPWLDANQATIVGAALDAMQRETSRTFELRGPDGEPVQIFLEVFARQPTLVIFGAVPIAVALVPMARRLGYRTVVADGRDSFLARERFPEADELVLAWPDEAFARIGIGPATYICVLSHDPKFDDPALEIALRSPAAYIGAIGSKKTQDARRARLRSQGFSQAAVDRLHGPIGLKLGGRSPAETALAILAEMTAVRYGQRVAAN